MRTLVIGDLHFDNKPPGLLDAQKKAVLNIYTSAKESGDIDDVIFLGDLMMHRRPYPRVLLALKEVVDIIAKKSDVYILRGNHDSENKSDDGVTALSLLADIDVNIITHTYIDKERKRVFIPHYENETKIKEALGNVPRGFTVFGHFGYFGSLNSAGDADFSIDPSEFYNSCILGHIHRFNQRTIQAAGFVETLTLLGTPYTTNFAEAGKNHYYAILDDGGPRTKKNTGWISGDGETYRTEFKPIEFGPRHLTMDYDMIEENLDWINAPEYFTLLRINLSTIEKDQDKIAELLDKVNVGYTEVKYKPLVDTHEGENINLINPIIEINDKLIEDYINSSTTTINKEDLLTGLNLIHENQQDRN